MLLFSQTGKQSMVYSRVTKATYWPICCYTTLLVTKKLLKCQKAYLIVTRVISKDCQLLYGFVARLFAWNYEPIPGSQSEINN